MLYQELPAIESTRLDRWGRWLAPALIVGAAATAALLLLVVGQAPIAGAILVAGLVLAAFAYLRSPVGPATTEPLVIGPDYALLGSALGLCGDPVALTTSEGSLLLVNLAYRERFGS